MNPISSPVRATGAEPPDSARLRTAAQQLEGVFVEQLFKAMRDTIPEGGLVDGGSGEEMFSGMLDQHLSDATAAGWSHGIGDALYRQLSAKQDPSPSPAELTRTAPSLLTSQETP